MGRRPRPRAPGSGTQAGPATGDYFAGFRVSTYSCTAVSQHRHRRHTSGILHQTLGFPTNVGIRILPRDTSWNNVYTNCLRQLHMNVLRSRCTTSMSALGFRGFKVVRLLRSESDLHTLDLCLEIAVMVCKRCISPVVSLPLVTFNGHFPQIRRGRT